MARGRWSEWCRGGEPMVWLSAACVGLCLLAVVGLIGLLAVRGLGIFWPVPVVELQYREAGGSLQTVVGQGRLTQALPESWVEAAGLAGVRRHGAAYRTLMQVGGEVPAQEFRWLLRDRIEARRAPPELMVVERTDAGYLYGYLVDPGASPKGRTAPAGAADWDALQRQIDRADAQRRQLHALQAGRVAALNLELERLRLSERKAELGLAGAGAGVAARTASARARLQQEYGQLQRELGERYRELERDTFTLRTADGALHTLPLAQVVRVYRPNAMAVGDKVRLYAQRLWEFLSTGPRGQGAVNGIFPAIFGTVLLVLLMSVLVMPFGVLAAVYLREYARQGWLTGLIRVALHNLAGVPSIVYGLFGLGFFVYSVGGSIDRWFFPEALPAPTFGTPGLFWASLTLALLTLPVVIVATEEGLERLPRSLREASLSLGATRWQTVARVVLPTASPALITGLILAVARAAGEVAPLMLVGVVKVAPDLPVDGHFPYLHLERKFMHLGYHIYDLGFQSAQIEASQALVYLTALLLVVVVFLLNLSAIVLRNRLRQKYRILES